MVARVRLDGKQRVLLPRHVADWIGLEIGGQALVAVAGSTVHVLPAAVAAALLGLSLSATEFSHHAPHPNTTQETAA